MPTLRIAAGRGRALRTARSTATLGEATATAPGGHRPMSPTSPVHTPCPLLADVPVARRRAPRADADAGDAPPSRPVRSTSPQLARRTTRAGDDVRVAAIPVEPPTRASRAAALPSHPRARRPPLPLPDVLRQGPKGPIEQPRRSRHAAPRRAPEPMRSIDTARSSPGRRVAASSSTPSPPRRPRPRSRPPTPDEAAQPVVDATPAFECARGRRRARESTSWWRRACACANRGDGRPAPRVAGGELTAVIAAAGGDRDHAPDGARRHGRPPRRDRTAARPAAVAIGRRTGSERGGRARARRRSRWLPRWRLPGRRRPSPPRRARARRPRPSSPRWRSPSPTRGRPQRRGGQRGRPRPRPTQVHAKSRSASPRRPGGDAGPEPARPRPRHAAGRRGAAARGRTSLCGGRHARRLKRRSAPPPCATTEGTRITCLGVQTRRDDLARQNFGAPAT